MQIPRKHSKKKNIPKKSINSISPEEFEEINIEIDEDRSKIMLNIMVGSNETKALFDTGAQISLIGTENHEIWNVFEDTPIYRYINVKTAGGEIHKGQGVKKIPVTFDGETKIIQVVRVPSIKLEMVLGMNFYNAWNLKIARRKNNELEEISCNRVENDKTIEVEEEHILTPVQKYKFTKVMNEFRYSVNESIGCQKLIEHEIDTGDNEPVFTPPYKYNPLVTEKIREILARWQRNGIIEPTKSNWRSPLVVVGKPNGDIRICLDARQLNAVTKRDAHTPPNVMQVIESIPKEAKYWVRLDLNEAFLQSEIKPEDRDKTAFAGQNLGEWQFVRMAFGLKNASITQSKVMIEVIGEKLKPWVIHYLDDIIVMGDTFEKLIENLRMTAKLLREANLTVSKKKTSGVLKKIRILGHIASKEGIATDPGKISVVVNWPRPKTGKEIQRFLGFCNWYRRYIQNYANIMKPLYEIAKNKIIKEELWTDDHQKAFERIKNCMTNAPILRNPIWGRKMSILTDACEKGVGAILTQIDDNGNEFIIEYYSYSMTEAERKYTPTELEMLAVLKAVRHFRYYIEFSEIEIISDHYALQHLKNMKIVNMRQARWILELSPYVNDIKHRAGKLMTVPDAISRMHMNIVNEELTKLPKIDKKKVCIKEVNAEEENEVDNANTQSENSQSQNNSTGTESSAESQNEIETRIATAMQRFEQFKNAIINHPQDYDGYHVENNEIIRKIPWKRNEFQNDYRIIPNPIERQNIIEQAHNATIHGGAKAMKYHISKAFWWGSMDEDIKEHLIMCDPCACTKSPNRNMTPILGKFSVPKDVMEVLAVDIKGPLPKQSANGYNNIIVIEDVLSRHVWAMKVRDVTSAKIINALKRVFEETGRQPLRLIHDNAKYFESNTFRDFLHEHDIVSRPTAVRHPQANPVERANRTISEALQRIIPIKYNNKQYKWAAALKDIIKSMNKKVNDVTRYSPNEVLWGKSNPANEEENALDEETHNKVKEKAYIRSRQRFIQNEKQFNKNAACPKTFAENEIVMIRRHTQSNAANNVNAKLNHNYEPAIIIRKEENYAYTIKKINDKEIKLNTKDIKPIDAKLQAWYRPFFENDD